MGNQADVPFFIHVVIKTSGLNQTVNVWVCGSFWLIQNHFRSSTEEGIRSRLYWSWFKVLCVSVCVCVLPAGHCALIRLDSFGVCSSSDSTLSSQTVTHFNCVCVCVSCPISTGVSSLFHTVFIIFPTNYGHWMKGYSCFVESPAIAPVSVCVLSFGWIWFLLPGSFECPAHPDFVIAVWQIFMDWYIFHL